MDLFAVDRAIAAAVAAHRRARENTAWEVHRAVSGQRALRELEALSPSAIEKPLQAALLRHVTHLTLLRVSQEAEQRLAKAFGEARAVVRRERDEQLSYAELWQALLAARAAGEARACLDALPNFGPALAEPLRTLKETREELLRRLRVVDASRYFLGVPHQALLDSARAWLGASRDLARDVTRRASGEARWPLDLDVRLARGAVLGWPAHLSWRSVSELLPGLATKLPLELGAAPRALGAASFARALFHLGASFRRAAAPSGTPFALREPPIDAGAFRTGALFAFAALERSFHQRVLSLSPGQAKDQARALACSALLYARFCAGCVLLGSAKASEWEELTADILGAPLPVALAGVWPRESGTSGALWLATLTAPPRYRDLREREGDDWFRSPRAFATLPEGFVLGGDAEKAPEPSDVAFLARTFEELLG